ncbi:MAG: hypothetical protein ACNFW9_05555 [Candidatus Kerfeldbacteria bacterium]|jgi:hypothetical protein
MKDFVVARNYQIQAILTKFESPDRSVMSRLKQIPEFPTRKLTRTDMGQSSIPGFFTAKDIKLYRWCHAGFIMVLVYQGNSKDIRLDIMDELDGWQEKDPRFKKRLRAMIKVMRSFVKITGLKLVPVSPDNYVIKQRMKGLQKAYGISQWLQGKAEEHLATVVLENTGHNPFVRLS